MTIHSKESQTTALSAQAPPKTEIIHHPEQLEHPALPHRRVMLAVDASIPSEHAVDYAIQRIINPETDLVYVMNVQEELHPPSVYDPARTMDDLCITAFQKLEAKLKEDSSMLIHRVMDKLHQGGIKTKGILGKGDARSCIQHKVEEDNIDILIVGSRGLGLVKRMWMGSVSSYLVNHCSCNVFVVKQDC